MALVRPVTKTKISTTEFGQPVYDYIQQLLTLIPTNWSSITTFQNGWISGVFGPGFRKIGDTVELRGNVKNGPSGSTMFVLPAGARPVATVEIPAFIFNSTWSVGNIVISPNGDVGGLNPGNAGTAIGNLSLWGIQFGTAP